jgi:hypothetical protein
MTLAWIAARLAMGSAGMVTHCCGDKRNKTRLSTVGIDPFRDFYADNPAEAAWGILQFLDPINGGTGLRDDEWYFEDY